VQGAHLFQAVLSPKGDRLALATSEGVILLDAGTWQEVGRLSSGREIEGLAYLPGSKVKLALATQTGAIEIWDLATQTQLSALQSTNSVSAALTAVAVSPDGHWLAAGSLDNQVYLWDLATEKLAQTFTDLTGPVTTVTFSPDSKTVAAGAVSDCSANVVLAAWNIKTGELVESPSGVPSTVNAVAYSPNGKVLATGGADGIVYLAPLNGTEPLQLSGHTDAITALAYSSDGKLIASGGADKTVILWNTTSGDQLYKLEGHQAAIASLIFLPKTPTLLSASVDGDLATWDTETGTLQKSLTLFSKLETAPVHC
jgi:WD40 repeat protein